MDEQLKALYNDYVLAGNSETEDQFLDAKAQMGDEAFFTFVNTQIDLKKKRQSGNTKSRISATYIRSNRRNSRRSKKLYIRESINSTNTSSRKFYGIGFFFGHTFIGIGIYITK